MEMQMENVQGRSTAIVVTIELTEREREVGGYIAEGLCDIEIAQMTGISINTVKSHIQNIRKRNNCVGSTRVELAKMLGGDDARHRQQGTE